MTTNTTNQRDDGRHDFDFLVGTWKVHHRKLADMGDPACDEWVEFEGVWASTAAPGHLDPPVSGRWDGKHGVFHGEGAVNGKPVAVRFDWDVFDADMARWEQAFSFDGGQTSVHNWRMSFTRIAD